MASRWVMSPLFPGRVLTAQPGMFNFTMKYITQPLKTMLQLRIAEKKRKKKFFEKMSKKRHFFNKPA